jgi:hypothetical protein
MFLIPLLKSARIRPFSHRLSAHNPETRNPGDQPGRNPLCRKARNQNGTKKLRNKNTTVLRFGQEKYSLRESSASADRPSQAKAKHGRYTGLTSA